MHFIKRTKILLLSCVISFSLNVWAMDNHPEDSCRPSNDSAADNHIEHFFSLYSNGSTEDHHPEDFSLSRNDSANRYFSADKYSSQNYNPHVTPSFLELSDNDLMLQYENYNNIIHLYPSSSDSSSIIDEEVGSTFIYDPDDYKYSLQFNRIINELSMSPEKEKKEKFLIDKWQELHTIGESFIHNATLYGRIIIEEYKLPLEKKTIKPVSIGGTAGGDKYIIQGILFKFAKDTLLPNNEWLYGGMQANDRLAAKSAGQELLSANYVGSHNPLIKVPLMAVVDYWGQRLTAMALLPINNKYTLVYGSANGGNTVFSSHKDINEAMGSLGKALNLQKHLVNGVSMALCGDIEVHKCQFGTEFQYYCLDTARVFPPEYGTHDERSVFYEKLRPEFVKSCKTPLSSDGLTSWQDTDSKRNIYDYCIVEATKKLEKENLKSYIQKIATDKIIEEIINSTSQYYTLRWSNRDYVPSILISHMHEHGINLRHLGKVLTLIEEINPKEKNCSQDNLISLKRYIKNFMISRVIKNESRRTLKEEVKEEKEYRDKFICIMNMLTCKNPQSEFFWQQTVPELLKSKFKVSIGNLHEILHQGFLLLNFCQLTGVILHPKSFEEFTKEYSNKMNFKFEESDIIDIKPTIKYINYIDVATGIYSLQMSDQNKEENARISMNYLQKAHDRLSTSLSTWCNETHPILPTHLSSTLDNIKERITKNKMEVSNLTLYEDSEDSYDDLYDLFHGTVGSHAGTNKSKLTIKQQPVEKRPTKTMWLPQEKQKLKLTTPETQQAKSKLGLFSVKRPAAKKAGNTKK